MGAIKFWVKTSLVFMIFLQWAHWLILGSLNGLPNLDTLLSVNILLNTIGAILGLSTLIMWIGHRLPVNNILPAVLLFMGLILFVILFKLNPQWVFVDSGANFLMVLAPLGAGITGYLAVGLFRKNALYRQKIRIFFKEFGWLVLLCMILGMGTSAALNITQFVLPDVIDYDIYKIDHAFIDIAALSHASFLHAHAWFQAIIHEQYASLSFFLYFMLGLAWRENRTDQLHIFRTLIVPFGVAYLLYVLMPASGPIYAFPGNYPFHMPNIADIPDGAFPIPPTYRNAMPSMHLTGALLIWLIAAALSRKVYFYLASIFVLITFYATMGLGEHYLLEMIVALPFAMALGTALINPPRWQFSRNPWWYATAATFLIWVALLIFARPFLIKQTLFVQLFSFWSVGIAAISAYFYVRIVWRLPAPTPETVAALGLSPQQSIESASLAKAPGYVWVLGLFVASGFAGLLYEVIFAKSLAVTFGATSSAAYVVMATYMGGMALGSWLGGVLADRVKRPLIFYAAFEGLIGVYALATPIIFYFIQQVYVGIAVAYEPDSPILTVWRSLLGSVSLGIPTVLMGTTLPIMFKYLKTTFGINTANSISRLYAANVFGAATGALVGGYVILPTLGRVSSTYLAALFSLLISLYAIDKIKQSLVKSQTTPLKVKEKIKQPIAQFTEAKNQWVNFTALVVITVGGMVSLALEVVNMHMLATVAGNSVYAFSLMLATFLVGLACGSLVFDRIPIKVPKIFIIVCAQFGLGLSILLTGMLWDRLEDYFASLGYMLQFIPFGFGARELIRAVVCAIVMIPPAFFIGLSYPATMSLASGFINKRGQEATGIGVASLCNTLGNILGVMLAGFWLMKLLGSNRLMLLLALVSFVLAFLAFLASVPKNRNHYEYITAGIMAVLACISVAIFPRDWNYQSLSSGANVYFYPVNWGRVIAHAESAEGGITSVTKFKNGNREGHTLLTNGKFQGNDTGEVLAQESFALIPVMHTPKRDNALVIGYGTGMSTYVMHQQQFKNVDVAELSKDMVSMANQYFSKINHRVTSLPGIHMYYTDGRNYLLTQNKRYDIISMEISSIWFAGAANLYNKEFYEVARKRLTDTGVLQQWVQLHHIAPMDLLYIINTARSEFKNVWFYVMGGQGILVASNQDKGMNQFYPLINTSDGKYFASWPSKETELQKAMLLNPEDINNIQRNLKVPQYFVSTDNNLYLEYSTPKGNAITENVLPKNIHFLKTISQPNVALKKLKS